MKSSWTMGLRGIVALALLTGAAPARGQTPQDTSVAGSAKEEPKIVAIRIVKEDGQVLSESPSGIAVETGKALDREKIAESLRALYRTGDYADLRAVVTPVTDGVRLDFVVRENLFFNRVRIEGLTAPPSDSSAAAAMQLALGQTYRRAAVDEALEKLRETLRDEGLYQAEVSAETVPHAETLQMDIVVHVKPGPRARVGSIQLKNGTEYRDAEILSRLRMKTGGVITSAKLQRGRDRIRKYLAKKGHLSGRAAVRRGDYDAAKNTIPLDLDVTEGPRVKMAITGAKFSEGELKKLIPIYQEGAVDPDLLEEGKRNVRERLERQGYFDASVDYTTETHEVKSSRGAAQSTEEVITYTAERGDRHKLIGIEITGNKYFDTELLKSRLQPYSDFGVTTDRDNILALYFNEGFPEARFSPTAERVSADPTAQKADASGSATSFQENEKKALKENDSKTSIEQAEAVRLVYHIQEGPQTRVRRIFIGGYEHTRPGVIHREVHIKVKEPLREGEVVESQRLLYNLGVFNRVTIEPQNPNGTNPEKDVAVLVEEAKRYTVAYGGGFEVQRLASTTSPTGAQIEAAPRGILEVSKLNLTGRGDSLSFKLRGSTLQGRALLGYSAPNAFANSHFSFQATAFAEKTRDINTFTEDRYEGSVQLTEQVTPLTTVLYRYAFRRVGVSNLKILSEEIPLFNQPTLVSQFGVTWFRDSRDNPAEASKGSFNSADFSDADTRLGSSASFLRFFLQNSTYYPIKRRFSFARSTRLGLLVPVRDTVSLTFPAPTPGQCVAGTAPSGPTPTIIPLPERFFAGGGTSLRGFALNQAGPRDACTGFPVGGQAMLIFNQEFRFPMRLPFIGTSLGGAIFYDGGNVYSRLLRISLRATLPAPTFKLVLKDPNDPTSPTIPACDTNCTNELNYFAHTIGLGVRYKTPVGPIRIDFGYQLNRPSFVIPIPCPSNSTNCVVGSLGQKSTQLPGFQVFFNLGSSF